eukprot:4175475-Amphidinium_carterae.1
MFEHRAGTDLPADSLTKIHHRSKLREARQQLGLVSMTDEQTNAQTHVSPTHNASHVFACLSRCFYGNHFGLECVDSSNHNQSKDQYPHRQTQKLKMSAFEEGIDFGVEEQVGDNSRKIYYHVKASAIPEQHTQPQQKRPRRYSQIGSSQGGGSNWAPTVWPTRMQATFEYYSMSDGSPLPTHFNDKPYGRSLCRRTIDTQAKARGTYWARDLSLAISDSASLSVGALSPRRVVRYARKAPD